MKCILKLYLPYELIKLNTLLHKHIVATVISFDINNGAVHGLRTKSGGLRLLAYTLFELEKTSYNFSSPKNIILLSYKHHSNKETISNTFS